MLLIGSLEIEDLVREVRFVGSDSNAVAAHNPPRSFVGFIRCRVSRQNDDFYMLLLVAENLRLTAKSRLSLKLSLLTYLPPMERIESNVGVSTTKLMAIRIQRIVGTLRP
jgi:hypothetical protein